MVIDYVIAEAEGREKIVSLEVGDNVDSDHHPMIVKLRAGGKQRTKVEKERRAIARGNWTEQGRSKFTEELNWTKSRGGKVEEDMEEMIEQVKRGLEKSREKGQMSKKKGWWDEECKKRKKELRGVLREWRKGRAEGESYRKTKREYNNLCKDKKREENEKFVKEVEGRLGGMENSEQRKEEKRTDSRKYKGGRVENPLYEPAR
uniref:vicilin-like seed storage protein At2g18540 n=1 Tax=Osmia lignaria TaxID=473952 RepID=UPI0014782AB8|nr:vicilin-like seed storage protein At2g18540 [Osmia lignaria]